MSEGKANAPQRTEAEQAEQELAEWVCRRFATEDRDQLLDRTLGTALNPERGEEFAVGDAAAGVTAKSLWFANRRIPFPVVVSVAVGDVRDSRDHEPCWVDINCTGRRSYRILVSTILDADKFLVALSRFMSFKVVPTVEDELKEQRRAEELEELAEQGRRRSEYLLRRQQQLLEDLIRVEMAPRIGFGFVFG